MNNRPQRPPRTRPFPKLTRERLQELAKKNPPPESWYQEDLGDGQLPQPDPEIVEKAMEQYRQGKFRLL